jgi:hypothetical protein
MLKFALCNLLTHPALELPLDQGLRLERRLFQSLFATQDQKEGEWRSYLFSLAPVLLRTPQ